MYWGVSRPRFQYIVSAYFLIHFGVDSCIKIRHPFFFSHMVFSCESVNREEFLIVLVVGPFTKEIRLVELVFVVKINQIFSLSLFLLKNGWCDGCAKPVLIIYIWFCEVIGFFVFFFLQGVLYSVLWIYWYLGIIP